MKDKWSNHTKCVLPWNVWRRDVLPLCVCVSFFSPIIVNF